MQRYIPGFNAIIDLLNLKPTQKMILLYMSMRSDEAGYCVAAKEKLADDVRITTNTLTTHLRSLETNNWITCTPRNDFDGAALCNGYQINFKKIRGVL